ncbi:HEAT repeat domain-containing protein [Planctomyces sp. SH-PL14]|uniref:HEAT repeat domain-containing protein n=1 Tax=Planctomyces sp. SH-PL14 TaxID=1632864 RepID=UPI00078EAEF3|nr:HEAT repeat domain-containing protein [Planctomyces sp. SH-PL14]AMV22049.1 hypothetical protein VT03_29370 [Planctomyces sp. SH-PL14]
MPSFPREYTARVLLTVGLLLLASTATHAQLRQRYQVLRVPPDAEPAPSPPTLEQRLDEVARREAIETGKPADRAAIAARISPLLGRINLWTPNVYPANEPRYLLLDLVFVNPTGQPGTLKPRDAVLRVGGKEFRATDLGSLKSYGVQFMSGESFSPVELVSEKMLPATLPVPAKGERLVRWVFGGLPRSRNVPEMVLRVSLDDRILEINLNALDRARLGLRAEAIGPRKCLALIELRGELDTVNVADLVKYLEDAPAQGATRAVIHGTQAPGWLSDHMKTWFQFGRTGATSQTFSTMPTLPAAIGELHLVVPPTGPGESAADDPEQDLINAEAMELAEENTGSQIHESLSDAVQEALRTSLEALPPEQLVREIESGHRLARAAALAQGGSRLGPELIGVVNEYVDGNDDLLKSAGLVALGEIRDPRAVARLEKTLVEGPPRLARIAMESLASSRFEEFHQALTRNLDKPIAVPASEAIEVLAAFAHPAWNDRLLKHCEDKSAEIRLAALRAVRRIGHPQLLQVLKRLVHDPDERVRVEAFNILVDRTDPEAESIAMEICLERLKDTKASDADMQNVYGLLYRTRDLRAVPPLLDRMATMKQGRSQIIGLLGLIGGSDVIDRLIRDYDKLTVEEKGAVLSLLSEQQSRAGRELAIREIQGTDTNLREIGLRYLASTADPQLLPLLRQRLKSSVPREEVGSYLNTLYQVGGPEAREILQSLRASVEGDLRMEAGQMLANLYARSPAYQFLEGAQQKGSGNEKQDHERMVEVATIALEMDPLLPYAWASRGNAFLWLNKLDEAERDFGRSVELDGESANALTGVAIVQVRRGKVDEGLKVLDRVRDEYRQNHLYLYNAACAYGRAVEQVEKEPASPERDAKLKKYQDEGLSHLRKAIDAGFEEFSLMKVDPDIATLRALPEYKTKIAGESEAGGEKEKDAPM